MKQNKYRKHSAILLSGILMFGTGCSTARAKEENNTAVIEEPVEEVIEVKQTFTPVTVTANTTSGGMIDATDLFTDRDLQQNADTSEAVTYTLKDGETVTLNKEGVYVFTGSAANAQIRVEAADTDKVQIVLDGVTMTNDSTPCIYVISADKVFVTTTDSENTLTVSGAFTADGETNTDAVIFSRDDLVINGLGTLNISSSDNGIAGKDDIKITGSTINIACASDAIEANDSIRIADGTVNITACNDGLKAENDEDDTTGYIYICGGNITVNASDDAIHATTIVQIDGGTFDLSGAEAVEGTYLQFNGGSLNIYASDDGINAAYKSSAYTPTIEINGGDITISMGQGDTDAIDSNGYIYVNGGTLDISAQSPFDYDIYAEYTGGTMIVNGSETTQITNQMMGGGMMPGGQGGFGGPGGEGGFGGQMPGGH
ncbi:MAG: carbohydrate-binding domain-containing protein [Solobacterium sp.]|nr:carbohydrate-binding domain-containing protein [Solobacterium sp.]